MRKYAGLILLFLLLTGFGGCAFWSIAYDNISNAITSSPIKTNKIKEPVLDSVKLSALWAGHSTVLIQMYDKVILADPFLTNTLGGLFMRKREAGLDINTLSKLDLILISHSHMDHLSYGSLEIIEKKFAGKKLVFPKGTEKYLPNFDFDMTRIDVKKSQGRDYVGNSISVEDVKITPVYAVHTGGRYGFDTYVWKESGVTGYMIQYKDLTVYFAGDTGYDSVAFKEIGKKFPKIDLAFIPIGPCRNCDSTGFWFHTSSSEALMLLDDIKAEKMIPIHYGAIKYIRDPDYPLWSLKKMISDKNSGLALYEDKVKILKEGEQIILIK